MVVLVNLLYVTKAAVSSGMVTVVLMSVFPTDGVCSRATSLSLVRAIKFILGLIIPNDFVPEVSEVGFMLFCQIVNRLLGNNLTLKANFVLVPLSAHPERATTCFYACLSSEVVGFFLHLKLPKRLTEA